MRQNKTGDTQHEPRSDAQGLPLSCKLAVYYQHLGLQKSQLVGKGNSIHVGNKNSYSYSGPGYRTELTQDSCKCISLCEAKKLFCENQTAEDVFVRFVTWWGKKLNKKRGHQVLLVVRLDSRYFYAVCMLHDHLKCIPRLLPTSCVITTNQYQGQSPLAVLFVRIIYHLQYAEMGQITYYHVLCDKYCVETPQHAFVCWVIIAPQECFTAVGCFYCLFHTPLTVPEMLLEEHFDQRSRMREQIR